MKIAVLDMYEGVENQGMRCIKELINQFADIEHTDIETEIFDVRLREELPDLNFDTYICSGGPGSPLDSEGSSWENKFFELLDALIEFNDADHNPVKKQVLFICHSFQLATRYFKVGEVSKRNSTSFGVFPMHYFEEAQYEPIFKGLQDPFYAVDSRDYQVTKPNHDQLKKLGGRILAIEKSRPHVPYERAVMCIRFRPNMIGTQFHPEADPLGMSMYLQQPDKKKTVIENHGELKWASMIEQLQDPDKIIHTYSHIIPNFLQHAMSKLQPAGAV